MRGRVRGRLVPVLASLISLGLIAPAGADALQKKFYGISPVENANANEFQIMGEGRVGMYRLPLYWPTIEPTAPTGILERVHKYEWGPIDEIVRNAANAGVSMHVHFIGTPRWTGVSSTDDAPLATKEQREDWRAFLTASAERYGRGGSFWIENPAVPVRAVKDFQVWNEANSSVRFGPKVDPDAYARLVRISSETIREFDPRARIILGGMFGTPGTPGSMDAWKFLAGIYKSEGTRGTFDRIALHPYSPDLGGIKYQIKKVRRVMRRFGDGRKPVEITELAWSSDKSISFGLFKTKRGQAKMLNRAFKLLLRKRQRWNIVRIMWTAFKDPDPPTEDCTICQKAGLLNKKLNGKPAWDVYRFYTGAVSTRPKL